MDERAWQMIGEIYDRLAKKPVPSEADLAYCEGVAKTLIATYKPDIPEPKRKGWRVFLP